MHVRKAHDELLKLLDSAPANIDTLTKAQMLLDGLRRENMDPAESSKRPNETVNSKLNAARSWFEIMCGVGEDGNWTEKDLRHFIRCDLKTVADNIESDGSHFKYWPK